MTTTFAYPGLWPGGPRAISSQSWEVGGGNREGLCTAGHGWAALGEEASVEHLALTLGAEGHLCRGCCTLLIHY